MEAGSILLHIGIQTEEKGRPRTTGQDLHLRNESLNVGNGQHRLLENHGLPTSQAQRDCHGSQVGRRCSIRRHLCSSRSKTAAVPLGTLEHPRRRANAKQRPTPEAMTILKSENDLDMMDIISVTDDSDTAASTSSTSSTIAATSSSSSASFSGGETSCSDDEGSSSEGDGSSSDDDEESSSDDDDSSSDDDGSINYVEAVQSMRLRRFVSVMSWLLLFALRILHRMDFTLRSCLPSSLLCVPCSVFWPGPVAIVATDGTRHEEFIALHPLDLCQFLMNGIYLGELTKSGRPDAFQDNIGTSASRRKAHPYTPTPKSPKSRSSATHRPRMYGA